MNGALETSLVLAANGINYTGWQDVTIERSIENCTSTFSLTAPERFLEQGAANPLAPFTHVTLSYNGEIMLTGFIFGYQANYKKRNVVISGRSMTAQLVDCTPDVPAGQYQGYTLAAIAAAICKIFGLTAKVQTSLANAAIADATLERGETAFRFIDRLATICGVLAYDDETGALVLGNAGDARANGAIAQGAIMDGDLDHECTERFSEYIVKGQSGIAAAAGASGFPSGAGDMAPGDDDNPDLVTPAAGEVLTQQRAVAYDPGVPFYRPKIILAEGQLTQAQLQLRANWQRSYAFGQSLKMPVTLPKWAQEDGTIWRINTLVPVNVPLLGAAEDLLILKASWRYNPESGHTTQITLGPVDGAIPSPSLLKNRRVRANAGAVSWSGVVPG